jgi:sugar O-acyltransferase (sialic acid O-acetyltransferase NeuD family)
VPDLLLIGSGGFARETAEAVAAVNRVTPTWNLLGFLDDDPARQGTLVDGLAVLGPTTAVHDHPEAHVLVCTGRPTNYVSRRRIVERLALDEDRHPTVIHPTASVGASCRVGAGSVLLAHAVMTADAVVGRHVVVMPHVVLTHDTRVGDWATLGAGVRVGGGARVGDNAYIGAAVALKEGITIGELAMVGMAAVVTGDVPPGRLYYGVPARDEGPAPIPPDERR